MRLDARRAGVSRRAYLVLHKEGLVCLDVSRYRGTGAFPGGPRAYLVLQDGGAVGVSVGPAQDGAAEYG